MAFSELYQALQSGVVDGTENTTSNLYTQKVHEVQKHLTVSNHGHISYAVVVNKAFWQGLPADIRSTLEGALRDATTYANAIAEVENAQALDKIRASGKSTVYTLTAEETAEWRKAMYVVHQDMADRVGKSTIQAVYKASGFVPPK
jgi:C4-dicarboxylate-binding protein DctP